MAEDIGFILFVQIFGMVEYPGAPFSGEIVRDIIQFLFIPSVFIILFIYMALGRLFAPENKKMRLMVGIAMYLFIVVTPGLYRSFAYLAGPYFMIFLIIIPAIYFIFSHFGVRRVAGAATAGGGGGGTMAMTLEGSSLAEELARKKVRLQELNAGLKEAQKAGDQRGIVDYQRQISELGAEVRILEADVRRNPMEWAHYTRLKSRYRIN